MVLGKMNRTFKRYSGLYWVVITLELLERGAYYGIMGYFPVHMIVNVGASGTQFGIMYAILLALLYTVPIVASSLAKRFGYKKILLLAFMLLAPSYYIMTLLNDYYMFLPLIITWGIGAGAFKPMVSATIAQVTDKETRNSAYSIYYLSINWGSLIAMVFIGFLIPQAFAYLAFLVGGVLITANLIITFIFYKDPVETDPNEKIFVAFKNMVRVLKDKKFALLILIYSGFFFIFSSMHTFLPVYYVEFGIKPWSWFEAPLMVAFNPLIIVIMGPFLSKFMDRFESLKLMITGMFIFSFGIFLLGMIPLWYVMIIGILIFSVGEFITHPNFISYVSKIAPKDKVALYMGYAFIPSAIGNVTGSSFGGIMWDKIAVAREQPSLFWGIYVGIGLITIANFLIYNQWIRKKKGLVDTKVSFWNSRKTLVGVYSLVVAMVIIGASVGTTAYVGSSEEGERKVEVDLVDRSVRISSSGELQEGDSMIIPVEVAETNVLSFNVTLTWEDEQDPPGRPRIRQYENQPDSFRVEVNMDNFTQPYSGEGVNVVGSEGRIEISIPMNGTPQYTDFTGIYNITVTMQSAGNFQANLAFFQLNDPGNDFDMEVEYRHLEKLQEEK